METSRAEPKGRSPSDVSSPIVLSGTLVRLGILHGWPLSITPKLVFNHFGHTLSCVQPPYGLGLPGCDTRSLPLVRTFGPRTGCKRYTEFIWKTTMAPKRMGLDFRAWMPTVPANGVPKRPTIPPQAVKMRLKTDRPSREGFASDRFALKATGGIDWMLML